MRFQIADIKPYHIFLISIISAFCVLLSLKNISFGSSSGHLKYHYIADFNINILFIAFLASIAFLLLIRFSEKRIGDHELNIVLMWFLIGFIFQAFAFSLYPYDVGYLVKSDQCTSFYSVAQDYGLMELVTHYDKIADTLPLHAKTNMIGKALLFFILKAVSSSPKITGYLIMLLSCIGGILTFYISKIYFSNRMTALYSYIFYLFIPSRIFFSPSPNSVSPVFILLSFLIYLLYLQSRRNCYLIFLGISFYATLIYEPLLFSVGIIFIAILIREYIHDMITINDIVKIVIISIATLISIHIIIMFTFHYDVINNFIIIYKDAVNFNTRADRPYWVWIIHNLKDFFINSGVVGSSVFILFSAALLKKIINTSNKLKLKNFITAPGTIICLAFAANLVVLNFIGINRGETIRLWIFMAAFMQICIAHACLRKIDNIGIRIIAVSYIVQTLATIGMVGFMIC
jgi:hypothetical protein